MADFKIQGVVTWGNVISVVTTIVAVAIGYQSLASDVKSDSRRIDALEPRVEQLRSDAAADRLNNTGILVGLKSDMTYLKSAVDELRATRRP